MPSLHNLIIPSQLLYSKLNASNCRILLIFSTEFSASLQNLRLLLLNWIECIIAVADYYLPTELNASLQYQIITSQLNWMHLCSSRLLPPNWIECIIAVADYYLPTELNASLQCHTITSQLSWMHHCKICLIFSAELNASLQNCD